MTGGLRLAFCIWIRFVYDNFPGPHPFQVDNFSLANLNVMYEKRQRNVGCFFFGRGLPYF